MQNLTQEIIVAERVPVMFSIMIAVTAFMLEGKSD